MWWWARRECFWNRAVKNKQPPVRSSSPAERTRTRLVWRTMVTEITSLHNCGEQKRSLLLLLDESAGQLKLSLMDLHFYWGSSSPSCTRSRWPPQPADLGRGEPLEGRSRTWTMKSEETRCCHHVNMEQDLMGLFATCWVHARKNWGCVKSKGGANHTWCDVPVKWSVSTISIW